MADEAEPEAARADVAQKTAVALGVVNSTDWQPAAADDLAAALAQLPALDLLAGRINRVMTERKATTAAARVAVASSVKQLEAAAAHLDRRRKAGRQSALEIAQRRYADICGRLLQVADD